MMQGQPSKINLTSGFIPRMRGATSKVDLTAGLIARERIDHPAERVSSSSSDASPVASPVSKMADKVGAFAPNPRSEPDKLAQVRAVSPAGSSLSQPPEPHRENPTPSNRAAEPITGQHLSSFVARQSVPPLPKEAKQFISSPLPRLSDPVPSFPPRPVATPARAAVPDPPPRFRIQTSSRDDSAMNTSTRMAGLRNLLYALGRKSLNQVPRPRSAELPPRLEEIKAEPRRQPNPALPQAQSSLKSSPQIPEPSLVTAPPEFLPPSRVFRVTESAHPTDTAFTNRRDRSDVYDDVEILPSWRGQYKRRG